MSQSAVLEKDLLYNSDCLLLFKSGQDQPSVHHTTRWYANLNNSFRKMALCGNTITQFLHEIQDGCRRAGFPYSLFVLGWGTLVQAVLDITHCTVVCLDSEAFALIQGCQRTTVILQPLVERPMWGLSWKISKVLLQLIFPSPLPLLYPPCSIALSQNYGAHLPVTTDCNWLTSSVSLHPSWGLGHDRVKTKSDKW